MLDVMRGFAMEIGVLGLAAFWAVKAAGTWAAWRLWKGWRGRGRAGV